MIDVIEILVFLWKFDLMGAPWVEILKQIILFQWFFML